MSLHNSPSVALMSHKGSFAHDKYTVRNNYVLCSRNCFVINEVWKVDTVRAQANLTVTLVYARSSDSR
jgi:hypothetical protein